MAAPLIGFAGVVIGGLLASLLSARQEYRRQRVKVRSAARLLLERFEHAKTALEAARDHPVGPEKRPMLSRGDYVLPEWDAARGLLADDLEGQAFDLLLKGIRSLERSREYSEQLADPCRSAEATPSVAQIRSELIALDDPIALLRILASQDLRSPSLRLWDRLLSRRPLAERAELKNLGTNDPSL
jgi:hypothetical protein